MKTINDYLYNKSYIIPKVTESNSENSIGPIQGFLTLTVFK